MSRPPQIGTPSTFTRTRRTPFTKRGAGGTFIQGMPVQTPSISVTGAGSRSTNLEHEEGPAPIVRLAPAVRGRRQTNSPAGYSVDRRRSAPHVTDRNLEVVMNSAKADVVEQLLAEFNEALRLQGRPDF